MLKSIAWFILYILFMSLPLFVSICNVLIILAVCFRSCQSNDVFYQSIIFIASIIFYFVCFIILSVIVFSDSFADKRIKYWQHFIFANTFGGLLFVMFISFVFM